MTNTRTRFFRAFFGRGSVRPMAKVEGERFAEAAPRQLHWLQLRWDLGSSVEPERRARGSRRRQLECQKHSRGRHPQLAQGAASLDGGGYTRGEAAAARDEVGRDERSAFATREADPSQYGHARCDPSRSNICNTFKGNSTRHGQLLHSNDICISCEGRGTSRRNVPSARMWGKASAPAVGGAPGTSLQHASGKKNEACQWWRAVRKNERDRMPSSQREKRRLRKAAGGRVSFKFVQL